MTYKNTYKFFFSKYIFSVNRKNNFGKLRSVCELRSDEIEEMNL